MKAFVMSALFASIGSVASAQPLAQSSTPVSADQLAAIRAEVPPELFGTPSLTGSELEAAAFRCDAASYLYGGDFYWISFNLAYAEYQALSACNLYYGGGCVYQCNYVFL